MLPNAIASLSFRFDGAIEHTRVYGQEIEGASLPPKEETTFWGESSKGETGLGGGSSKEGTILWGKSSQEEIVSWSDSSPTSAQLLRDSQVTLTRGSTALDIQGPGELALIIRSSTSTQGRANVQIEEDGALVSDSMLVGHIPQLNNRGRTSTSLVTHTDDDQWMRMVWNKDSQQSYSVFDYQSEHLPSIMYRNKRTIDQVQGGHAEEIKKRHLLHPAVRPPNSLPGPVVPPSPGPLDHASFLLFPDT